MIWFPARAWQALGVLLAIQRKTQSLASRGQLGRYSLPVRRSAPQGVVLRPAGLTGCRTYSAENVNSGKKGQVPRFNFKKVKTQKRTQLFSWEMRSKRPISFPNSLDLVSHSKALQQSHGPANLFCKMLPLSVPMLLGTWKGTAGQQQYQRNQFLT